jgi:hypothetical protein
MLGIIGRQFTTSKTGHRSTCNVVLPQIGAWGGIHPDETSAEDVILLRLLVPMQDIGKSVGVIQSLKADDPCHGAPQRRLAAAFPEIASGRRRDTISTSDLKRKQMMC